jgi:prolyl-tRNA synthetase
MKTRKTAIVPTREQDYPQWYQEVIKAADLAENSVVRGCMVIKPWGYAIWENIQQELDKQIKATGHQNFYFPMFVPLSFLAKEAEHIDGFAKECAVITHHRLEVGPEGVLVPGGKLEEPLIVRPTSEAIIGEAFSRWINSYRDLPVLGNQWANVVRWEMRPRIFLRTSEFLWQEGHTAHATADEAVIEAKKMLEVYRYICEDLIAMPVILGKKTEHEKFPGADTTYCLEAMMQDKKALQAGTSHFLGQNFAKAFNIKYLSKEGKEEFVWTTSWGVTTRLIGGLIMTHSDDDGLVLPPKIAPIQVVIVPLIHKKEDEQAILEYCEQLSEKIKNLFFNQQNIKVELDLKDKTPGEKIWGWIKKGVPIRLEIGAKELSNNAVFMGRRDLQPNEKSAVPAEEFLANVESLLGEIQNNLFKKALNYRQENSFTATNKDEFYNFFKQDAEASCFVLSHWIGDDATEEKLKQELKVAARCIPLEHKHELGKCIFTGKENAPLTLFSKAY